MSASSSRAYLQVQAESSSSHSSPSRQPRVDDDSGDDADLLAADPLSSGLSAGYDFSCARGFESIGKLMHRNRLSFKRRTRNPSPFAFPNWFSSSPYALGNGKSPTPRHAPPASSSTEANLPYLDTGADLPAFPQDTKDTTALDWYAEGPGRRVGYEDLTAIDWIFEYAKERQRLRVLHNNTSGITGYIRQIADASQVWWVMIATGIAAGAVAAFIDIASNWLGDLKQGVCSNVQFGGKLYLSRSFCCWGVDGKIQGPLLSPFMLEELTQPRNGQLQRLAALGCSLFHNIKSRKLDLGVLCLHYIFRKPMSIRRLLQNQPTNNY
jgi:chloride channel 3/4/5